MAFIFTMHPNRRDMPSASTLPAISEDVNDTIQPDAIVNSPVRRPWSRNLAVSPLSFTSKFSDTSGSDTDQEKEKHLPNLLGSQDIAKRGGWRRLALVVLVAVLCVAGLIVGLVIGLKNMKDSSDNSSGMSSNSSTTDSTEFPAGSYMIQTYLSNVTTNCTSNPSTWRCYPYTTYTQSTMLSAAIFSWIITMNMPKTNPPTYSVSSTSDPFSIMFSAMPLTIQDANLDTEHYTFVLTSLNKPVVPSTAITTNNIAATCYFNQTSLEARLYTKMAKTYPPPSPDNNNNNNTKTAFAPWPYAVYVDQIDSGGPNVPQCYDNQGNRIGSFADETGGQCSCLYMNYGM